MVRGAFCQLFCERIKEAVLYKGKLTIFDDYESLINLTIEQDDALDSETLAFATCDGKAKQNEVFQENQVLDELTAANVVLGKLLLRAVLLVNPPMLITSIRSQRWH